MRHIRYQGKRLIRTSHPRRGLSALLCVCMILSIVNFTAIGSPARADDPPVETRSFDLEEIPKYEKALHFLIRHWHMEKDETAQYQGGTALRSGDRYITVAEGYIIPAPTGGGYKFYAVNQGTGKLSEMDPEEFPSNSNYVESMDPATGEIILTPYFVLLGGDPVEQFAGWSISTGHDAVDYRNGGDGTEERLVIQYRDNVHLVKGHAFYISAGEIVEGSVLKTVFGGDKVAMDLEKDVDWAWVFTVDVTDPAIDGQTHSKDSVAVDKDNIPYSEFDLPSGLRPYVEWVQIHNTNQGLHTDKTAYDHLEYDPESGKYVSDGRTYDVDLKAWYTAGYAPVVGMVLDASGSMGFAADNPEPIQVTKEKLGAAAYAALEDKIGYIQRHKEWYEKFQSQEYLRGYYEFQQNAGSSEGTYRLWYFNSAKDNYKNYNGADIVNAGLDLFAHAVKRSTLDNINFSVSAPVKNLPDFNAAGWSDANWGNWGEPPATFSSNYGFSLTARLQSGRSGFLLDVAPQDVTDFTIAFTLRQDAVGACTDDIEILYIGPKVADSGDSYFHVYRSGGSIIAKIGDKELTLEDCFGSIVDEHKFSFVFSGDTVTAYVDGSVKGGLAGVPAISSSGDNTRVVFAPFDGGDNYLSSYFYVDSIYLINAALDADEAKLLNNEAGKHLDAVTYSIPDSDFLTPEEQALLLDTHKTDNSNMGFNGYSYFVYDPSKSTAEYVPLSYYTNDDEVPNLRADSSTINGVGWYYVSSAGDWSAVSKTTKRLYGVVNGKTYEDTIEEPKEHWVDGNNGGAAPDMDEDTISAGNSGAPYKPSANGPTKFYIDKKGYLRCFFSSNASSEFRTSYVYELRDDQYVKEASLQRALGDFITQLNEVFPQSDVAATRFSTANATQNNESYKLVLLDWTHDVTQSVGAMGQRWRSDGSSTGTHNYPKNSGKSGLIEQYNYVFTGGTSTYTGLYAFQRYLAPVIEEDEEDHPERFLIIFTDGKDSDSSPANAQRVADDLKKDGYTIFTVLLSAGTVAKGTEGYDEAHDFLLKLSGSTSTEENKEQFFFSVDKAKDQIKDERAAQEFGGKDDGNGGTYKEDVDYDGLTPDHRKVIDEWFGGLNMNTADMLTQIFSKEILSRITQPLENYVVQDYIDPRFDLVAGIATKKIDSTGLADNITYNSTGKNDYTLHLRVGGEIAIGNENATEIYATVNLKDGTITNSDGYVFEDEDGNPLDSSLIITRTRTADGEEGSGPGEDPEEGQDPGAGRAPAKYYLNIHLTGASRAAIRFACLFYDEANQMYYLQWMDQTIPASTYNQSSLSVWRARVTLRAKEDFLGGNAVLTNGQLAHMNYVYHAGDSKASSGTERSYRADPETEALGTEDSGTPPPGVPEGEYLSKGFPRVTVNVALPDVGMHNSEWTLWMGETMDPAELMQTLAASIDNPLIWDGYMSRYGHSIVSYPDDLKELTLTQLTQLSSLYRLHVAIDEIDEEKYPDPAERDAAVKEAEAAYNAYRASMDPDLIKLYDDVYKEYADTVKNPEAHGYSEAIYNKLRRALLAEVGIGRDLTYYSTNQLMAGLLDDANTEHGLYLPYAYLNSFDMAGGSEGNQAGLINEQQRDVLGVIRYRWERVNYYTGETIKNGGYFRNPGEGKLENGVPSLNQEFTIYDTRTLLYRLTVTFWPFPDPSDTVWDSLIYVHDVSKEAAANQGKMDGGRYKDGIRYEAVFERDDDGNRIPMDSGGRKEYLADCVKTPLEKLQKALTDLEDGLTGYKTQEELEALMVPFSNGEYRKELYNGVTEMGFDTAIWGDAFGDLNRDINEMLALFDGLDDDESNTEYYAQRLEVRDKIDLCLEDLRWFTYAVEYLEWCIGVQDTGGKFSHLDRTNDRNQFNYDDSGVDDGLDPDGYDDESGATILTLIKDEDYRWTKEAVGTIQYYKEVEGSRTTHIVRGELAFEMKLDINELEYLFTTEWKDKAETGVTYHVKLTSKDVTDTWENEYGGLKSPGIPEELTITITKEDLERLRERAAVHAEIGDNPVGTLYYQMGGYSTDEEDYDTRLPDPNLAWYPKAVYDMRTGEVTFYTDPRIYDPVYLDENGEDMYVTESTTTDENGVETPVTVSNNDYARLLPRGTYTLTPNMEANQVDWWMFAFDDFDYAPREDYARGADDQDNIQLRRSHFTDNTADNKANAVNSVYAPYIDAMTGATQGMEQFKSDSGKYAPPNTSNDMLNKRPADGSVTFYLGTYDYNAVGVTNLQRLTARVGMGMVKASLKYEMPATGGPGTGAYLLGGGALLLAGLAILWSRRRRDG